MPQSTSVFKQTEELLEEVFRAIREECEKPTCVLCESDRKKFVEEEEILRERLKDMEESNNWHWRRLFAQPSPDAAKCLKDAEELHQRVKEYIRERVRIRLTGQSNPPPSPSDGQSPAFNSMGSRTPETDTGRPLADVNPEPASTIRTSPLNTRCSSPEVSELIVYPQVHDNNDYTSDSNESINTLREMSSNQSRDSSSRSVQSSNLFLSSETTTNPGSGSARRSHSVRRSATTSPQLSRHLRTPGLPINGSFPSPGPLSPSPVMMSSVSEVTQQVDNFVSSIVKEGLSGQAQARRGLRHIGDYATKTNCVDNIGSDVVGLTLNNGGSGNSGAVIHMVSPLR